MSLGLGCHSHFGQRIRMSLISKFFAPVRYEMIDLKKVGMERAFQSLNSFIPLKAISENVASFLCLP